MSPGISYHAGDPSLRNVNPYGSCTPTGWVFEPVSTFNQSVGNAVAGPVLPGGETGIAFDRRDGTIAISNVSGTVVASSESAEDGWRVYALVDANGDGQAEVLAGAGRGAAAKLYLFATPDLVTSQSWPLPGGYDQGPPIGLFGFDTGDGARYVVGLGAGYSASQRGVTLIADGEPDPVWHYAKGPESTARVAAYRLDGVMNFVTGGATWHNGGSGCGTGAATCTNDGEQFSIAFDASGAERFTAQPAGAGTNGMSDHMVFKSSNGPRILAAESHDAQYYSGTSRLYSLDAAIGSTIATYTGPANKQWAGLAAADLVGNDGVDEIVALALDGSLRILDENLNLVAETQAIPGLPSGWGWQNVRVTDANGDQSLDIVVDSYSEQKVYFFDPMLQLQHTLEYGDADGNRQLAVIGDLNGDDQVDLLFSGDVGAVWLGGGADEAPPPPADPPVVRTPEPSTFRPASYVTFDLQWWTENPDATLELEWTVDGDPAGRQPYYCYGQGTGCTVALREEFLLQGARTQLIEVSIKENGVVLDEIAKSYHPRVPSCPARMPEPAEAPPLVVLVHGIFGNDATFQHLAADLAAEPTLFGSVRSVTYRAAEGDRIIDMAYDVQQQLLSFEPDRPLLFVAHSMGGLIVRTLLDQGCHTAPHRGPDAEIAPDWFDRTVGTYFLGTPHRGAGSAAWGNHLDAVRPGDWDAVLIDLLTESSYIEGLPPPAWDSVRIGNAMGTACGDGDCVVSSYEMILPYLTGELIQRPFVTKHCTPCDFRAGYESYDESAVVRSWVLGEIRPFFASSHLVETDAGSAETEPTGVVPELGLNVWTCTLAALVAFGAIRRSRRTTA